MDPDPRARTYSHRCVRKRLVLDGTINHREAVLAVNNHAVGGDHDFVADLDSSIGIDDGSGHDLARIAQDEHLPRISSLIASQTCVTVHKQGLPALDGVWPDDL